MTPGAPISPQVLVDLCCIEGWSAVHVTQENGSVFSAGHIQVFYALPHSDSPGRSRMFFADTRCIAQIAELRQEIKDAETTPKYKATQRYSFGFTDPRGIFGLSETKQEGAVIKYDSHT